MCGLQQSDFPWCWFPPCCWHNGRWSVLPLLSLPLRYTFFTWLLWSYKPFVPHSIFLLLPFTYFCPLPFPPSFPPFLSSPFSLLRLGLAQLYVLHSHFLLSLSRGCQSVSRLFISPFKSCASSPAISFKLQTHILLSELDIYTWWNWHLNMVPCPQLDDGSQKIIPH